MQIVNESKAYRKYQAIDMDENLRPKWLEFIDNMVSIFWSRSERVKRWGYKINRNTGLSDVPTSNICQKSDRTEISYFRSLAWRLAYRFSGSPVTTYNFLISKIYQKFSSIVKGTGQTEIRYALHQKAVWTNHIVVFLGSNHRLPYYSCQSTVFVRQFSRINTDCLTVSIGVWEFLQVETLFE